MHCDCVVRKIAQVGLKKIYRSIFNRSWWWMFMMTNYIDFLSSNNAGILVVLLCLFAGIIVGNVHDLIAFWQNRGLRNQGRCHDVSLAVADLLVGLLLLPIWTYQLYYLQNPFHLIFCVFNMWIDILCETASIVTLTVIIIDRCYKITVPLQYKSKKNSAYRTRRWLAQSNGIFRSVVGRSMPVKDLKNAKTLAIFVLAFIVCWVQYFNFLFSQM